MMGKKYDRGVLTEDVAAGILQKVDTLAVLLPDERLHVLHAVLDRCEETGGRMDHP